MTKLVTKTYLRLAKTATGETVEVPVTYTYEVAVPTATLYEKNALAAFAKGAEPIVLPGYPVLTAKEVIN